MPLHLVDTAGLRESDDPVEKIGIERAWKAVEKADIALLLLGDTHLSTKSDEIVKKLPESLPLIVVQNKIDLNSKDAGKEGDIINISAKYNLGIDILKEELKERMGYQNNNEGIFIARRRHLQALERTQQFVDNAEMQLTEFNAGELMAEELRLAQDELSQITGKFTSDDLLGEIFSSFCIGK